MINLAQMADSGRHEDASETALQPGEGNGSKPAPLRPRDARQMRYTQAFAQIVAVLMRDPGFRRLPLADLEWLVLPPIMAGQWRLGQMAVPKAKSEAKDDGGMVVPVNVALWARVSAAIDLRLTNDLDKAFALKPNEWAAGDHVWLIAAAGDPRSLPTFLQKLNETEFKDQIVKVRARDADGKTVVRTLAEHCAVK